MKVKKDKDKAGSSVSLPEVKILIIEDNKDHLNDMRDILSKLDEKNPEFILKVEAAESKEEAEKILFEEKKFYDVLIVDIMLGEYMDGGMDIIENLKKKNTKERNEKDKKTILVITETSFVVSHRVDGLMRKRAKEAGVKAYFQKPLPYKEFRKILRETILETIQH
jgi:CheY-like chemotaxis protein